MPVNAWLTSRRVLLLATSLATFAIVAGASSTPDYQGTAVIVGIHPPPSTFHATRPVVVLHHDPMVGLMDERMEMPFIAASRRTTRCS
jgi:hypothetical protein